MTFYRVHPAASADARAALKRYQSISPELGNRFRAELRVAIAFIRRYPAASPEIGEGVRRKLFRRPFLYALWYTIENEEIVLWAVGHQHREPGFWSGRKAGGGAA